MELVVFLVSLFGFLALGIPIAIVLVLCSMVLMYYGGMWDSMFVMIIPQSMLDGANNYPLMAIPFFVFAGEIMTEGGLSKRVVKLAQLIIGRVRGGLGYAAIVSSVWSTTEIPPKSSSTRAASMNREATMSTALRDAPLIMLTNMSTAMCLCR